jgi:creatinine amidohydrolase/Fe(II)-dependent formamide hydrolase-like protein
MTIKCNSKIIFPQYKNNIIFMPCIPYEASHEHVRHKGVDFYLVGIKYKNNIIFMPCIPYEASHEHVRHKGVDFYLTGIKLVLLEGLTLLDYWNNG